MKTISEQCYQQLLKAIEDGILLLDGNSGEIIDVNPVMLKLLECSREEFLGKNLWEIEAFSFIKESGFTLRDLQNKRVFRSREIQLKTKGSKDRIIELSSKNYQVGLRKVIQLCIHDITKWKRQLNEVGELAKILAENPNPVLRLDHDGSILFANKEARKFLLELHVEKGGRVPKFWREVVSEALKKRSINVIEAQFGGHIYSYLVSPVVHKELCKLVRS